MKRVVTIILLIIIHTILFSQDYKLKEELCNNWPEYFNQDDELKYIGNIEINDYKYSFYQNFHIFGNSRMNAKLIIVQNGQVKGFYNQISETPVIEKSFLLFPFEVNIGNSINFINGIPHRIYLDGEINYFMEIDSIK